MSKSAEVFLDTLLNLPEVKQAFLSPDRTHIALNIANLHLNWDVFLTKAEGTTHITSLTNTKEYTLLLKWWPDSQSIIVGEDKGGNERIVLYRVFLEDLNKWQRLTPENPDYYVRGAEISPDGKSLYYFVNYDFSKIKETEIFHLFRKDIATGDLFLLTSAQKPAYNFPSLNLAGTMILYNRSDLTPGGTQYWVIKADGNDDREILNFGAKAKVEASWHPDSEHIAFITDSYEGKRLRKRLTGIYSVKTEDIEWINGAEDLTKGDTSQHDFDRAYVPRFAPTTLVLFETQKAKSLAFFYDLKKKRMMSFPRLPGTLKPFQRLDNGHWLGFYYSSTQPTTLVSFPVDNLSSLSLKKFKLYFDNFTYSPITKKQLVSAQDFDWKSEDGTLIHGWLYKARKQTNRAIIYVHGGPTAHSEDKLNSEIQYYVSLGFHVLDPNYRGSTGYGVEFREIIKEDGWGGREQVDIAMGAQTLIEQSLATRGRIGITGTSYGGFSAWSAITRFPELITASAPVCGMTDLVVDYETTRPDLRPHSEEMMGGSPEEVPERYKKGSPINYIHNIRGKVLIVQGTRDPNVTPANVIAVEGHLKANKIVYEKLIFEDEGHGIVKKKNQRTKMLRISNFFNQALQ